VVGHVELDESRAHAHRCRRSSLAVASAEVDHVAQIHELPGCFVADALIGAGDEGDRHGWSFRNESRGPVVVHAMSIANRVAEPSLAGGPAGPRLSAMTRERAAVPHRPGPAAAVVRERTNALGSYLQARRALVTPQQAA